MQKVSHVKAGWALVIAGWLQYDWRGLSHEFVKVEGPDLCFDGDCCQTSRVMHYLSCFLRCSSLSHSLFSLMAHPECPVYVFSVNMTRVAIKLGDKFVSKDCVQKLIVSKYPFRTCSKMLVRMYSLFWPRCLFIFSGVVDVLRYFQCPSFGSREDT